MIAGSGLREFAAGLAAALLVAACGGGSSSTSRSGSRVAAQRSTPATVSRPVPPRLPPHPVPPPYPQLLPAATVTGPIPFTAVASWRDRTAAWISRTPGGVTLLSFDQRVVKLTLHSGTVDAGTAGWRYGPVVGGLELRRLVAAFNGGFRLDTGAGGFMSYGNVAVPLRAGEASIVTYTDGYTDIGAWRAGVPAPGRAVASVRQNLTLLVDNGAPAGTVDCVTCWGATLGGADDPARSALGVTADGTLVWAGGEHLTPADLAGVLIGAHVERAVELDINPEWVAAYLYNHHGGAGPVTALAAMPDQSGIPGQLLAPYSRDFFTVSGR